MKLNMRNLLTIAEKNLSNFLYNNEATGKIANRKRWMASRARSSSPRSLSRSLSFLAALIFALSVLFAALQSSKAAAPTAGSIGPGGPMASWDGTAVGGASDGETTCAEGVNCDTYTLNVSAG